MPSPLAPRVEIELDQPRHLVFDFNAIRTMEKETGRNMLKPNAWADLSASDIVVFIWACLKHEDPQLTIDQVGAMIHSGNMAYVLERVTAITGQSVPKGDGATGNPRKRPNG